MDERCRVELLGGLRVDCGGRVLTQFRTRKVGALLAYLAFHRHRAHPRDELIEVAWPGATDARHKLRKALASLRRQLEPPGVPAGGMIVANRTTVQLNPDAVTTDVVDFEAAVRQAALCRSEPERARHLEEAVGRYRGELLPGYYETWIVPERQRLAEVYQAALGQLIHHLEQSDRLDRALDLARRAVNADPLREEAQHELIRLLVASGHEKAAVQQYEQLERLLEQEAGASPDAATRELIRTISGRKGRTRPGDTEAPESRTRPPGLPLHSPAPPEPPPVPRGSLPLPLTRFFGREQDLHRLRELFATPVDGGQLYPQISQIITETRESPFSLSASSADKVGNPKSETQYRLVTLTGPGGGGKTRLALALAQQLEPHFEGAVWFVPLADLADPRLIPDKIAEVLRLPRSSAVEPLEQVAQFLAPRTGYPRRGCMLVLDNFEHLTPGGVSSVQGLLERVKGLTLLVTSRHRLELAGEREYPVAPLPVPVDGEWLMVDGSDPSRDRERAVKSAHGRSLPHGRGSDLATLAVCPSAALFVDRAQGARPDFQLTPGNAAAVAGICARLEGLPLAIELAAAWARVLRPAEILARLEQRFELLSSRARAPLERHRSLRAALDWSYRLLSPKLQRFFAQLSVFRGGWTLEAAERICGEGALDYLWQLRGCSMVQIEENKEGTRFRLLETLREYGAEQLDAEEQAALARRHAQHYLALAEAAEPELRGPSQGAWLDRLTVEHDNLRAALAWAVRGAAAAGGEMEAEIGLRLGGALFYFWRSRGAAEEGRHYLAALLASPGAAKGTAARAIALDTAAGLAHRQSDFSAARAHFEECLAIYRALGDQLSEASLLADLGDLAKNQGDHARALAAYEESLARQREIGNKSGIAVSLRALGKFAQEREDYATARARLAESLAASRESGEVRLIGSSLGLLGAVAVQQADYPAARTYFEEGLALCDEQGDRPTAAGLRLHMGRMAQAEGNYEAARACCGESLAICRDIGDQPGVAKALFDLGRLDVDAEEPSAARTHFEAALAIHRELGQGGGAAAVLSQLASLARQRGDDGEARRLYAEGLAICRKMGNPHWVIGSLQRLGQLARDQGDCPAAEAYLEEALTIARDLSHPPSVALVLYNLGQVAADQGDVSRARSHLEESLALRRALGDERGVEECLGALAGLTSRH